MSSYLRIQVEKVLEKGPKGSLLGNRNASVPHCRDDSMAIEMFQIV